MSVELETSGAEEIQTGRLEVPRPENEYASYRALSSLAVGSLVIGLLSVVALFDWALGLVPLIGILVALRAQGQIRRNPQELTGLILARAGLVLSLGFLLLGWTVLTIVYYTEVPDGYTRISYSQLQPDEAHPGELIPASAAALEGKKVFIKGYMFPGPVRENIRTFILVRDNGDCCFGGKSPKLTDMIQVTLAEPLKTEYSTRVRKLAGTFHIAPVQQAVDGVGGVLYQLDGEYLR